MENLIRVAVATSLTIALTLICSHGHAQDHGPRKISCASADRSVLLEANLNLDSPQARLTNLLIKNHHDIHRPAMDPENIREFYYDPTFIHIRGRLANGKDFIFGAQPSVSQKNTWTAVLQIDSKSPTLSCDVL